MNHGGNSLTRKEAMEELDNTNKVLDRYNQLLEKGIKVEESIKYFKDLIACLEDSRDGTHSSDLFHIFMGMKPKPIEDRKEREYINDIIRKAQTYLGYAKVYKGKYPCQHEYRVIGYFYGIDPHSFDIKCDKCESVITTYDTEDVLSEKVYPELYKEFIELEESHKKRIYEYGGPERTQKEIDIYLRIRSKLLKDVEFTRTTKDLRYDMEQNGEIKKRK